MTWRANGLSGSGMQSTDWESPFVSGPGAAPAWSGEQSAWEEASPWNEMAEDAELFESDSEAVEKLPGFTLEETLRSTSDAEEAEHDELESWAAEGDGFEHQLRDFESESLSPSWEVEPFASESWEAPFAEEHHGADFEEALSEDEVEPAYVTEDEASSVADLRRRIVELAKRERDRWGNGSIKETNAAVRPALMKYWQSVTSKAGAEDAIKGRSAWSAAFISWVMKEAGAGTSFKYNPAHRNYIAAAKKAREAGDASKFWAYRLNEARPEPGDLVCRDRIPKKGFPCSGTDYDNVGDGKQRPSHCDIVIDVRPDSIVLVGGNVSDSVAEQKIVKLDSNGFIVQPAAGCKIFGIMKPAGASVSTAVVPLPSGGTTATDGFNITSLPTQLSNLIRSGVLTAQAAAAIASGNRDESHLANLIFYARHPELPVGHKIQKHETRLVQEWLRARDTVRKLLTNMPSAGAAVAKKPAATKGGINARTVARIDKYAARLDAAAKENGVSANVLRGIIAAESAGNPNTGAGTRGYKGLMQSGRETSHLDPDVSINAGAKKYKDFEASMRRFYRKALTQDFDALPEDTRIRIIMASYNAGPGTVQRAIRFARKAGDAAQWLAPEHYLRALVSTGAYNPVEGVVAWCVKKGHVTAEGVAADYARLSGTSVDAVKSRFAPTGLWNGKAILALAKAIRPLLFTEKAKLKNDGSETWTSVQSKATRTLLCAAQFKQAHTNGYLETVLRYKKYYDGR